MSFNKRNIFSFSLIAIGLILSLYREVNKYRLQTFFKTVDQYYHEQDYDKCEEILYKYCLKNKEEINGWTYLGTVYLKQNKDSLAEEAYQKSLKIKSNAKALTGLGVISMNQRNYQKAEEYYKNAIKNDPEYGKAYSSLLIIEIAKRNFQKAVNLGEIAIKLDPNNLGVKGNLMTAYHFINKNEERDKLLEELEKANYHYLDNLKLLISGEILLEDVIPKY
ncbi:MAG: tetratricopeptide (TPR) repeat protein [Bacteroidia bacterium]|jgi:tetratricopeptide (TPR) repeat protein